MVTSAPTAEEEGLYRAVIGLGDTADEIAGRLAAEGVKGHRGISGSCPLAVYAQRHVTTEGAKAAVGVAHVSLIGGPAEDPVGWWRGLPDQHVLFIAGFDAGLYPGLDSGNGNPTMVEAD